VTTIQSATNELSPLSSISDFHHFDRESGLIDLSYDEDYLDLLTSIQFIGQNGIVEQIRVEIRELQIYTASNGDIEVKDVYDSPSFGSRIQPYTMQEVISGFGAPSSVLIRTFNSEQAMGLTKSGGFELILVYPIEGIFLHYTTQMHVEGETVYGCLDNAHVELWLFPSENEESFIQNLSKTEWAGVWPTLAEDLYWKPIDEVTNYSKEQFITTFSQNNSQCLFSSTDYWIQPFG
jgi:hypothetical protein